jgi:peptidoglycan/xylan/chitin deacetylase (PgdA/CDA1 family)
LIIKSQEDYRAWTCCSLEERKTYVITSWDDTTKLDLKLADLLEKYNIKGTFFVTTGWVGSKIGVDDLRHLSEAHEIGAHTISHPHLRKLSLADAEKEISKSGQFLSEKLDVPLYKMPFAYPYGEYSDEHVGLVKSAGYCCARTTKPFHIEQPYNLYEMGVSVWVYPHAFSDLIGIFRVARMLPGVLTNPAHVKKWGYLARHLFDMTMKKGGVFHLFGHAQQIDENNDWCNLDEVLNYIGLHKTVTYVTLGEYCRLKKEA